VSPAKPGPESLPPSPLFPPWDVYRMTRTELLDTALRKLAEAVKLLDSAGEELLADDALELAERINFRISIEG
jgi:hypothetical protein